MGTQARQGTSLVMRAISLFAARFLLIYGLLSLPWPGLIPTYTDLYCESVRGIARGLGLRGRVVINPDAEIGGFYDSKLGVRIDGTRTWGLAAHSSRYPNFSATSFLAGLLLAIPLRFPRRLIALALGMLLVHVYLGIRIASMLLLLAQVTPFPSLGWTEPQRLILSAVIEIPWPLVIVGLWAITIWRPFARGLLERVEAESGAFPYGELIPAGGHGRGKRVSCPSDSARSN